MATNQELYRPARRMRDCRSTRPSRRRRSAQPSTTQGYYVGRVDRNLYWVTDGIYQAAFLTTPDGVVLFDAPPSIGHNLQRAIDEIANANGVSNKVTYLVHTHHHADHVGASSLFGKDVVRIGHEETRRLLLRDDDPARPAPTETFSDRRTLEIGGERIELAWHGPNHTPDNSIIHFPDHRRADDGRHRQRGLGAGLRRQPVRGHPRLPGDAGHGADLPVEDAHQRPPGPGLARATTSSCTSSTWRTSRPASGRPDDRRSDAVLPELRRELWAAVKGYLNAVGDATAAPVIEKYTGVLAAADVFTPERRLLADGVDPARPWRRLVRAPVTAALGA